MIKQSISHRFSYTLIGVVTLTLLGYATIAIFINVARSNTALENRLTRVSKLAGMGLATPLWNLDKSSLSDFIEALFLDDAIVYVKILPEEEISITRVRPEFEGKDFSFFEGSSQFIVKTSDILYEGKKIGAIQLAMSRESVQHETVLYVSGIIALTISMIAAISVTSLIITRRYIFQPLLKLKNSAALIASGDLQAPIDTSSNDEIGSLARDLNVMRESIQSLFEDLNKAKEALEDYNRTLEQRVAERTQELKDKNDELAKTLQQLKDTQNQLIVQENLASLGALTAGIAHEIKNPLNFVNNFAELSMELMEELLENLEQQKDRLDPQVFEEIKDILDTVEQNLLKVKEHGKRADSIVRGMLAHSRGTASQRELIPINTLLAEYVNLAYHGMRAKDSSFNVTIKTDYDLSMEPIEVIPQDISRVFLNIVNNACYAVHQKKKELGDKFSPTLWVKTKNLAERVEIRIRDNGTGIPQKALDKIFNPFFTTKPSGEGTGLGLSISYDIIVQGHKGEIRVETVEGSFTEFIITLPKKLTFGDPTQFGLNRT